jgi:hypothetical protein
MRPALLEAMPPMREDLLAGAATALGSELDAVRVGGGGADNLHHRVYVCLQSSF